MAQEKGCDPLLWAVQLTSCLNRAGVSLPSPELADVLVSYICWENNVPILWKFLDRALVVNIAPPLLVIALLSTRLVVLPRTRYPFPTIRSQTSPRMVLRVWIIFVQRVYFGSLFTHVGLVPWAIHSSSLFFSSSVLALTLAPFSPRKSCFFYFYIHNPRFLVFSSVCHWIPQVYFTFHFLEFLVASKDNWCLANC